MEDASKSSHKRKAAVACDAFPHGSSSKRRPAAAAEEEQRDWTSLHQDVTKLIADRLLAEDVTEYIVFRAVCAHWRASAPSPRDPTLADRKFHPRGWVALCDGTGVRPVDAEAIAFLHASTGRVRRVRLWEELQGQRVVGFTDGLVLLLDAGSAVVRVLHPFTRVIVQLPSLAGFFHNALSKQAWFKMEYFVSLSAAVVCVSTSSIAVVVWFPDMPVVICAEPSSEGWAVLHTNIQFTNTLPFDGRLYGVTRVGRQLVQVYPVHTHVDAVVAEVPKDLGHPMSCRYYLVESMGAMLVAVLHSVPGKPPGAFTLFKVDLRGHKLTRVPNLGDQALFLADDRCLSVSAKDLPSISSNSIYFATPKSHKPTVHSLDDGSFESFIPTICILERDKPVTRWRHVRPFTLAEQLLTYCHHREWTRGLMFPVPGFSDRLKKWFDAQDTEVVVPRLREPAGQLDKVVIRDLSYASALARITGTN